MSCCAAPGRAPAKQQGTKFGTFELAVADDFEYTDPIDGSKASKQGLRFIFSGEAALPRREGLLCHGP